MPRSLALRNVIVTTLLVLALWLLPSARAADQAPTPSVNAAVIGSVFGPRYARQAVRVAWCESRLTTTARNGQYRGLFQMGSWERRRFGHGSTAQAQARAAHRYFVVTGRDWSPWSCRHAAT